MSYLGKDIPKLGFGLMRLPMIGKQIDIEQTKAMTDKFLAAGFTYLDKVFTAYIHETAIPPGHAPNAGNASPYVRRASASCGS
jgi:predicted aldo/keto reductase-like oxidoreductase